MKIKPIEANNENQISMIQKNKKEKGLHSIIRKRCNSFKLFEIT